MHNSRRNREIYRIFAILPKNSDVPIITICTMGVFTEQIKRSKVSLNGKVRPYLWSTEVVFLAEQE